MLREKPRLFQFPKLMQSATGIFQVPRKLAETIHINVGHPVSARPFAADRRILLENPFHANREPQTLLLPPPALRLP